LHALFNFIQILAKMYDVERDTCLGTLWSVYKIFLCDLIKTSAIKAKKIWGKWSIEIVCLYSLVIYRKKARLQG